MSVLPISKKRPPPGSSSSEASTNSPRQGVEHDVHPLPAGGSRNFSLKSSSREEAMWSSSRPSSSQGLPLGGAGGGEDLGAEVAGDLDGRHPHAAGAGVDQDPLALLQAGEVEQAVVGGEEGGRGRGRLLEGPGPPGPRPGGCAQRRRAGRRRRGSGPSPAPRARGPPPRRRPRRTTPAPSLPIGASPGIRGPGRSGRRGS